MVLWVDCLGEYDAEGTAWTALAGGAGSSPYTPQASGTIVSLRCVVGRDAATSLTDHVQFRLKCKTFGGVDVVVGVTGAGLATAPTLMSGATAESEWPVQLPIQAGVPITIEARDVTADTPVTNAVFLYATIQS